MRVASGLPSTRGQRDKGLGRSNASHSSNPSTTEGIWIVPGPIAGMPAMARCALPAWYNVYRNRNNWEPIASGSQAPRQYPGTHCLWLTSSRADRILAVGNRLIRGQQGRQSELRSATGAPFPTGSTWATMPIVGSSFWANRSTSGIVGQSYESELRGSYSLR